MTWGWDEETINPTTFSGGVRGFLGEVKSTRTMEGVLKDSVYSRYKTKPID